MSCTISKSLDLFFRREIAPILKHNDVEKICKILDPKYFNNDSHISINFLIDYVCEQKINSNYVFLKPNTLIFNSFVKELSQFEYLNSRIKRMKNIALNNEIYPDPDIAKCIDIINKKLYVFFDDYTCGTFIKELGFSSPYEEDCSNVCQCVSWLYTNGFLFPDKYELREKFRVFCAHLKNTKYEMWKEIYDELLKYNIDISKYETYIDYDIIKGKKQKF